MSKPKRPPLRDRLRTAAGAAAETAGICLRHLPGIGGPLLVSYGLGTAWSPLGWIALGAFLLLADRRIP